MQVRCGRIPVRFLVNPEAVKSPRVVKVLQEEAVAGFWRMHKGERSPTDACFCTRPTRLTLKGAVGSLGAQALLCSLLSLCSPAPHPSPTLQ